MKQEEKINYLRIALGLQQLGISNEMADRIITTYEKILQLKGAFSITDAVQIELGLDKKYKEKEIENKS